MFDRAATMTGKTSRACSAQCFPRLRRHGPKASPFVMKVRNAASIPAPMTMETFKSGRGKQNDIENKAERLVWQSA